MRRPVDDRHQARAARLALLQQPDVRGVTVDQLACDARARLWAARPGDHAGASGGDVLLRAGLILRGNATHSPLLDVAAPRSAAVQLLLVALLAAQSRRPAAAAGHAMRIPLRDPVDSASTCWRYLVALPTVDTGGRHGRGTVSRTPTENRLAQLRTAFTRLHERGRIELAGDTGRGRFENVKLLNEEVNRRGGTVPYRRPAPHERVVRLPVEFFTNGWVHALTDSEIAAYLFLLLLQQENPLDLEQGMPVPREQWADAFGSARAHIGYRMLSRFGLIRIFRQEVRRDDGTIEDFGSHEIPANEPLRFVVDIDALQVNALTRVLPALRAATHTRLDEAWCASWGIEL